MKRVLLTGASGFLGRAIAPALISRGFEVHGTGRSARPPLAGMRWHAADLLTDAGRAQVVAAARPSHLVHLAWEARPGRYREDPVNRDWAAASIDLLARARAAGAGRILGIGSCLEYGPHAGLCDERSECRPTTLYGAAKLDAARAFLAAGTGVAWGRVFFPFGPHEPEGRLIPRLIHDLRAGRRFDCSHGRQLRDFIYVEDLAQAVAAVLESDLSGAVNLGSGELRSLRSVVEHFAERLGGRHLVRFGAVEVTGVDAEPVIAADVSLLRSATSGAPCIGFEQGAERDIAWWTSRLSGAS
jgi:nucleoside-diphosphate-sugar epimerase